MITILIIIKNNDSLKISFFFVQTPEKKTRERERERERERQREGGRLCGT